MTMKHKDIILHTVDLRECDLIITQTQVRRKVIEVIVRLKVDTINKGRACNGKRDTVPRKEGIRL